MIDRRHLLPYLVLASIVLLILPVVNEWAEGWLYRILLAGPALLVPMGMQLVSVEQSFISRSSILSFISALLFLLAAYCLPTGVSTALLSLPWLLFTFFLAVAAIRNRQVVSWAWLMACTFLPVAAAWMTADRLGWQPLGFDPLIVLLTGVHFHYAGFALAVVTTLLPNSNAKQFLSIGLLPGVAGVAIGITSTQLAGPNWIEVLGVTTMVIVGIGVGIKQIQFAWQNGISILPRLFLTLGGLALVVGLSLALLYGWRFHYQWEWLTIPWMYATHGLLNSLGFAFLSFLGRYLLLIKPIR